MHVSFGRPLQDEYATPEALAAAIDQAIHCQYRLFGTNLVAAGQDGEVSEEERSKFEARLAAMPVELRELVRATYGKPSYNFV